MPELIHERLRRLRDAQGWSVSTLSRRTVAAGDSGIGEKTIEAIERARGRIPDARIIEALARAFDVDPASFYEYPIAVARRDARPTPSEAEERFGEALQEEAQRSRERPPGGRNTNRASRRRQGGAE